ncbi:toll-like receptor 2 isoform X2 [Homarus americanus]|uniref:toll-like receptor 2 isoform X2 n=1 Tax=Homarus americanus TaxID=6706 RepID=UPI001C47457C|nr:toll-like receptor 2 isoform X2 [Homarus americanus]
MKSLRVLVVRNLLALMIFINLSCSAFPNKEDYDPPVVDSEGQDKLQEVLSSNSSSPSCTDEESSHNLNSSTSHCPDVASLYRSASKWPQNKNLAVRLVRIDGTLNLTLLADMVLVSLSLQGANVTHISYQQQQLCKLMTLDLSNNPNLGAAFFQELEDLPSLTNLLLHRTSLATIRLPDLLSKLTSIQHLDVSYTGLRDVPLATFQHNKKLKSLNLAGNRLIQINLDKGLVQQLTHLNMSGCELHHVRVRSSPAAVETGPGLFPKSQFQILDVSHNHLASLPASLINVLTSSKSHLNITDNLWQESCNNCSLYYLNYFINMYRNLVVGKEEVQCFDMEALFSCSWEECPLGCHCNKRKKTVDCTNAGLETIPFVGPADAETLLMSSNNLHNLSGIDSPAWCNLTTLIVDQNQLSILVPPGLTGHCPCHENWINNSEEKNCTPQHLQTVNLSHNKIKSISSNDCSLLYPVMELNISSNLFQSLGALACVSLQRLQVLRLDHNMINNVAESEFATYPYLQELYLSNNTLEMLQPRITDLMFKLKILDVSHNLLAKFSSNNNRSSHSPFSSMGVSPLEEVYLHDNKFSQIEPVLDLEHISTLKTLTLYNNLWSCNCASIKKVKGTVFKELKNHAFITAVTKMQCHLPAEKNGTNVMHMREEEVCQETSPDTNFMSMVAFIIMALMIVFVCYHMRWSRLLNKIISEKKMHVSRDPTVGRTYDVFVVHAHRDYERVKQHVIAPLTQHGYSVAWHDNVFRPGDWVLENVERAVRNSRRMLVVVTDNLLNSRWCKQEIRRGRHEEFDKEGFKILALMMDPLPQALPRDLYEIVALRTHVLFTNRDYIERICNFLPAPAPQQPHLEGAYLTDTNIRYLLERFEAIRQRDREHRSNVCEVFSMARDENNKFEIRSEATWPVECQDETNLPTMSEEERREMIRRYNERPPVEHPTRTDTTSLNYIMIDDDNEEEGITQLEGFTRSGFARYSCKF